MKAAGVECWNVFLPVCRGNSWPQTSSTNPIKLEQKILPAIKTKPFALTDWIFPPPNPSAPGGFSALSLLCSQGDGDSGAEPSREGKARAGKMGKVTLVWDWDHWCQLLLWSPVIPAKPFQKSGSWLKAGLHLGNLFQPYWFCGLISFCKFSRSVPALRFLLSQAGGSSLSRSPCAKAREGQETETSQGPHPNTTQTSPNPIQTQPNPSNSIQTPPKHHPTPSKPIKLHPNVTQSHPNPTKPIKLYPNTTQTSPNTIQTQPSPSNSIQMPLKCHQTPLKAHPKPSNPTQLHPNSTKPIKPHPNATQTSPNPIQTHQTPLKAHPNPSKPIKPIQTPPRLSLLHPPLGKPLEQFPTPSAPAATQSLGSGTLSWAHTQEEPKSRQ